MALPSGATLTNPTCISAWVEYPFRDVGDSITKIYHHAMKVKLTSYVPLADDDVMTAAGEKPENSPFSDDANAFYIGDDVPKPIDGGMVEFIRSFSNIPQDRTVPNGLYAFDLVASTKELSYEVTGSPAFTITGGLGTWGCTFSLSASDAANFPLGDSMFIDYGTSSGTHFIVDDIQGNVSERPRFLEFIIDSKTGTDPVDFVCSLKYPDGYTALSQGLSTSWKFNIVYQYQRGASSSVNTPSLINYRYVKTNDTSTIDLAPRFTVVNKDGVPIAALDDEQSSPNQDAYIGMIANNVLIGAEDETFVNWRGNIWEVFQIMVRAI
jgi:hypothetical protein